MPLPEPPGTRGSSPTGAPPAAASPSGVTGVAEPADRRPSPATTSARRGGDLPTVTLDGRPIPDFGTLGINAHTVGLLAAHIDEPAELLRATVDEIRYDFGLGPSRTHAVQVACARAGYPLGCVADTRQPRQERAGRVGQGVSLPAETGAPVAPPVPVPGSPIQPGEHIWAYTDRIRAEIKAGIRDQRGEVKPREVVNG